MKFIDKSIFLNCVAVFAHFLHSNDYEQVGVEKVETHIGEEVQVAEKEGVLSWLCFQQVNGAILDFNFPKFGVIINTVLNGLVNGYRVLAGEEFMVHNSD